MTSVYISFDDVHSTGQTFEERIGPPDACTSALGHVTVGFSWLEKSLDNHISDLAKLSPEIAPALTAELPFKTKVSVLSSLVRHQPPIRNFNCDSEDPAEIWDDILKMLYTCEDHRNRLVHSHWSQHWSQQIAGKIQRTKTTAKAKHGIRVTSETLTAGYLLDVYDYILNVQCVLDEYFL